MKGRTYRYLTAPPLYPFGYGLTYGNCTVTGLRSEGTEVSVTAKNEGGADTEEVIELYIRDEGSEFAPPNPVLCGFQRVFLKAGEEKEFRIQLQSAAFTVVTGEGKRITGSGKWRLYAGFGAPDARTEELTGKKNQSALITTD